MRSDRKVQLVRSDRKDLLDHKVLLTEPALKARKVHKVRKVLLQPAHPARKDQPVLQALKDQLVQPAL